MLINKFQFRLIGFTAVALLLYGRQFGGIGRDSHGNLKLDLLFSNGTGYFSLIIYAILFVSLFLINEQSNMLSIESMLRMTRSQILKQQLETTIANSLILSLIYVCGGIITALRSTSMSSIVHSGVASILLCTFLNSSLYLIQVGILMKIIAHFKSKFSGLVITIVAMSIISLLNITTHIWAPLQEISLFDSFFENVISVADIVQSTARLLLIVLTLGYTYKFLLYREDFI